MANLSPTTSTCHSTALNDTLPQLDLFWFGRFQISCRLFKYSACIRIFQSLIPLFPLKNQPVVPGGICDDQLQCHYVHVSFHCTQRHFTHVFCCGALEGRNYSRFRHFSEPFLRKHTIRKQKSLMLRYIYLFTNEPTHVRRSHSAPLSSGIPLFPGHPGRRVQRADHVCAADQTVPPQKVLP